jgi:hypothetical protein
MAIDTDSAMSTSPEVSGRVRIGSGSHGPTQVSRWYRAKRSRSSAMFDAIPARYAFGLSTFERSAADHLNRASWTVLLGDLGRRFHPGEPTTDDRDGSRIGATQRRREQLRILQAVQRVGVLICRAPAPCRRRCIA